MYERFSTRARNVMHLANREAQRLRHEYIGTEHILLGLLREQESLAAIILMNLGVRIEALEAEIEKILHSPPKPPDAKENTHEELPKACPKCGQPIVRVIWAKHYLLGKELEEIKSGQALLGSISVSEKSVLQWACLQCTPKRAEVHRLAMQDYELQVDKEKAIEAADFMKAAQCSDTQMEIRRRSVSLHEELSRER